MRTTTNALTPEERDDVRRQVRAVLERTSAFGALSAERRRNLASDLVQVLAFLTDPAAGDRDLRDVAAEVQGEPSPMVSQALQRMTPVARAQADDSPPIPQQPTKGSVTGAAIDKGTEAFESLVGAVDFPAFVSGLIEGVFTSIVDSSIRQMEAYGELLANVTKSIQDFANDNITDGAARDYLMDQFPRNFTLNRRGNRAVLQQSPGLDEENAPDVGAFVGLPGANVDDEQAEAKLVQAAKLKMARARQQQLATMVVLGINRIVVTDGHINAKVVFDVKMSETADFKASAQYHDAKTHVDTEHKTKRSFWGTSRTSSSNVNTRVTTLDSNTSQQAHESIEAKAKLTGEVSVNFKSETFPLEKLASPDQLLSVSSLSGQPQQ
ncbi:MAG: hypothetical protein ABIO70_16005 [Pseudomonadota bacterium]